MDTWLWVKGVGVLSCLILCLLIVARITQTYLMKERESSKEKKLKILERKLLDSKRSLVRIEDEVNSYLILLGSQTEHLLHIQPHTEKNNK